MNKLIINESATIRDSLKKMDKGAKKILFVIDNDNKLIGAISDGDIRRAILNNIKLDEKIIGIYNKSPKYIKKSEYSDELCKQIMLDKKIEVIPITENGEIVDIMIWDQIFSQKEKKIKNEYTQINIPVVIMAGGKGTRMEPFTKVLPKPLIPIGEQTILEHIMYEFNLYGINNFSLTLNYKGEMIKSYLEGIEHNFQIKYYTEKDFYGTAGSLSLLKDVINETFIVTNCDIIVKANYSEVLKFHYDNEAILTIISSIQHHKIPYGVIEYENGGKVINIKEKPEFSFPVNTGVYILNKKCLDFIPQNEYFDMPTLIDLLIKENYKVVTFPINQNEYIDIGQWEEYKSAIERMIV